MLRDIILGGFIVYCMIRAIKNPWVGILAWTLLSILNPHRFSWRLDTMPVAAAMVAATLIGLVVTRDKKSFPVTRETIVLMLMMVWFCITLPFSFNVEGSYEQWIKVMKIDGMLLVALMTLESRKHIMALAWVLAISLGFYGVKGGLFTLVTGGHFRVWGPPGSYIEGNNELALALENESGLPEDAEDADGDYDELYDKAIKLFGAEKTAQIIMAICTINVWNRIGVSLHMHPE